MKLSLAALSMCAFAAPAIGQETSADLNQKMLDALKGTPPVETVSAVGDDNQAYQVEEDITDIVETPSKDAMTEQIKQELTEDRLILDIPGEAKASANETGEIAFEDAAEDDVTVTVTEDADGHMMIEKRVTRTRTSPNRSPKEDPDRAESGVSVKVSLMSQNDSADSLNLSIIGDRITETRLESGARQFTIKPSSGGGKSITVTIEEK